MITAVIPAYNEQERIGKVLRETSHQVDEMIVIDDASDDDTAEVANKYAKVIRNRSNLGYIASIKRGFEMAAGDIIVTLDADGEHDPAYIPDLIEPIKKGQADLVFGRRKRIPRISERLLSSMAEIRVNAGDTGTGYRAIKKEIAEKLILKGYCTCGVFALEARKKGATIAEVKAPTRTVDKPKKIAWIHLLQFFVVLKWLFK